MNTKPRPWHSRSPSFKEEQDYRECPKCKAIVIRNVYGVFYCVMCQSPAPEKGEE